MPFNQNLFYSTQLRRRFLFKDLYTAADVFIIRHSSNRKVLATRRFRIINILCCTSRTSTRRVIILNSRYRRIRRLIYINTSRVRRSNLVQQTLVLLASSLQLLKIIVLRRRLLRSTRKNRRRQTSIYTRRLPINRVLRNNQILTNINRIHVLQRNTIQRCNLSNRRVVISSNLTQRVARLNRIILSLTRRYTRLLTRQIKISDVPVVVSA